MKQRDEDWSTFLAFAEDNSEALVGLSLEHSQMALDHLFKRNISPGGLVRRIAETDQVQPLMEHLRRTFQHEERKNTPRWIALVDALLRELTRFQLNEEFAVPAVRAILSTASAFDHLWRRHRLELARLADYISANQFWIARVQWFTNRGDFRRAWDEIRSAAKGFRNPHDLANYSHVFAADKDTLAVMANILFKAMIKERLLTPNSESELSKAWSESVRVDVFENRPHRKAKGGVGLRRYNTLLPRAGFQLAAEYFRRTISPGRYYDYFLEAEGVMILKIAEYFRQKKSEQRRRKYEEAMAAQPPQTSE